MIVATMVAFLYAALLENVFVAAYGCLFPWRSTALGRQMLFYAATVAALMDLTVVAGLVWQPPVVAFLGGYLLFGAALTWRTALLVQFWRQRDARPVPPGSPSAPAGDEAVR